MSNNVSLLLGDGLGGFGAAANLVFGSYPAGVAVGDFNRDNQADFAVANQRSEDISIALGDGTGGFGAAINLKNVTGPAGFGGPFALKVRDFNGDQNPDLIAANNDQAYITVLLGDGRGGFKVGTGYAPEGPFASVDSTAVGDYDGTPKPYIAAGHGIDVRRDRMRRILGILTNGESVISPDFNSGVYLPSRPGIWGRNKPRQDHKPKRSRLRGPCTKAGAALPSPQQQLNHGSYSPMSRRGASEEFARCCSSAARAAACSSSITVG